MLLTPTRRTPALVYGLMIAIFLSAAAPLVVELVAPGRDLRPQGEALGWNPTLVGLHVLTDTLTGLAYVVISVMLIYLARKAGRAIPFLWAFVAFGVFIIACGFTHFAAAVTIWEPVYWVAGSIKYVTAVASVATAAFVPGLVPQVLALVESARVSEERRRRLETTNRELAALTERLEEADRLKTAFFANVSHELRTPLTLILGSLERRLASGELGATERQDLATAERNARILLRHVNDLLDVARLDAGKTAARYAAVDLAGLVQLSAAPFETVAAERGIAFAVETPRALTAEVDPDQVQRVLINLLGNAFKFVPDRGTVAVGLEVRGGRATIVVDDSGPGVPPELREAVFERFRQVDDGATRRHGGTGLGLAIARELVGLHGGSITVGTAPAGGARFRVELPLRAPAGAPVRGDADAGAPSEPTAALLAELPPGAAGQTAGAPPADADGADRPTVLVVEDNPDMARFVAHVLGAEAKVEVAADGARGLARARELRPDLIVSDVMMPGLSGDQLVRAVRAEPALAGVPIVLLTAKADDELRVRLLEEGAQDYLIKPFSPQELRARVGNLLALKRVRDALQADLASREQDVALLAAEAASRAREAEAAVRARDEFLSVAAHELRTPVSGIKGYAQLLERMHDAPGADPERTRRAVRTINRSADRLVALANDLLDVSRIQLGQLPLRPEEVDAGAIVAEVAERLRERIDERHRLTVEVGEGLGTIEVDPERLRQVLDNLLDNAVKYSPQGGEVRMAATGDATGVTFLVSDQGIGLPPEELEGVFAPFGRAANALRDHLPGLGLGLAIARSIAERHGGTIAAESAGEGQGTTFRLWLPRRIPRGEE